MLGSSKITRTFPCANSYNRGKRGENYYISCKMIEVATARIEKQSTGTTTEGLNDIPQTTQYIVKRLFGENVQQQSNNAVMNKASGTATMNTAVRTNEGKTTGSAVDDLVLLVILETVRSVNNLYKKGDVGWFDPSTAQWYIKNMLARPYNSDDEMVSGKPVNKKVLVEFTKNKEIEHRFDEKKIFKKGDLVWFNDDIGTFYVRNRDAIFRNF